MKNLISKSDRFFIAGSTGMVGQATTRALRKSGYGEKKYGGALLIPSRKELNLLNLHDVENWFRKNNPTVVIIAAAKVGGILANNQNPADFILENLKIQTNLIEASWKSGVKRLLFLGSSCIYPKFASQPIEEESLLTGGLESTNEWYAIAKIAGIKLCEGLRKQYNFDAISLMPTNLYGFGDNYHPQNSHVMASFIRKFHEASANRIDEVTCWGTGKPLREFLHVDDLAEAIVFALEKWDPNSNNAPSDKYGEKLDFLNVGSGKEISIKELAYKIASNFNYEGTILWDTSKPDGTPRKMLNSSRIKDLGWFPKISLDEGIKKVVDLYKHF